MLFSDLHALCAQAGLTLIMTAGLAAFFDTECINPRNASMLERMSAPMRLDDVDDREHMGLYRVFVFVRAAVAPSRPLAMPTLEDVTAVRRLLPVGTSLYPSKAAAPTEDRAVDKKKAHPPPDAEVAATTAPAASPPSRPSGRAISAVWSSGMVRRDA